MSQKPKVTHVQEAKDPKTLPPDNLFGSLNTDKMMLGEDANKKKKRKTCIEG